jgi:hypothetical protein
MLAVLLPMMGSQKETKLEMLSAIASNESLKEERDK